MADLRIAIDTRPLKTRSRLRGIGCYISNLLKYLIKIGADDEFFFLCAERAIEAPPPGIKGIFIPPRMALGHCNWLADLVLLNRTLRRYSLDVVHYTSPFEFTLGISPSRKEKFRSIATVHDLIGLRFHGEIFRGRRKVLEPFYRTVVRSLPAFDLLIAVSECTKMELVELARVPEEKIRVVYLGVAPHFCPQEDKELVARFKKSRGLPDDFLLYVGGFSANKNWCGLLEALRIAGGGSRREIVLVTAGSIDEAIRPAVLGGVQRLNLEGRVLFLGYVPGEELPLLYASCTAFIFPSFWEGFGLPALEAMACGAPVVCSRASSLPEVVGDAALLVDPLNIEEMAAAIVRILGDSDLRHDLAKKGKERSRLFDWEATARRHLKIYRKAAQ